MGTDTREAILARLTKIAERLPGLADVKRMEPAVNVEDGPVVVIFDGPESRDRDDRKPGQASSTFTMRPEFLVFLQAQQADAGKTLNKIRAAAIKAVVFDTDLKALSGPNGLVRYAGCETAAERGAAVSADAALIFEVTYVLNPNLL